ncbi:MAG: type II secretion system protein [Candidatus Pacebacteria bacterium]|nr:type II secretion system protein [Candidatus Paceibacterota bacterium]
MIGNNKSFTLIETVVALGIFIAISAGLGEVISVSIQNQIKITSMQNIFSQSVFSLDKIEKELRMAKKDTTGNCVGTINRNFSVVDGGVLDSITFLYYDQDTTSLRCKKFAVEGGRLKEFLSLDTTSNFPAGVEITSSSFLINSLNFIVSGDAPSDNLQPKITILMNVSSTYLNPINIETTISQRRLDL